MTPDERKMLNDLADKIGHTPSPPKDPEAEEFIRTRIGSRPDALYLMTQTVLIQNLALAQAQEQIQQLQSSAQTVQTSSGGTFLGQRGAPAYSGPSAGQQYAAPAPPPPQYLPPSPAGPSPSAGPSFLRGAAQTAAGVAAGALAFEGIRALFSHPGYGGAGFGGFGNPGFGGGPVEETVVNNYYDSPGGNDLGPGGEHYAGGPNTGSDIYAPDDASNLDNTSNVEDVSGVDDSTQFDDSGQYDDTGDFGDSGGFDNGGGFDDSGTNFV